MKKRNIYPKVKLFYKPTKEGQTDYSSPLGISKIQIGRETIRTVSSVKIEATIGKMGQVTMTFWVRELETIKLKGD